MKIIVDIIKEYKSWNQHKLLNKKLMQNILDITLSEIGKFHKCNQVEFAVLLCNNEKITQLNTEFRNKDSATNVLSFPDRDLHYLETSEDTFTGDINLGDIAMAYDTIDQEAKAFDISFENHCTHLLVHAILHLIGYDHEEDEDSEMMENLEIKILKKLHIKKPPIYA